MLRQNLFKEYLKNKNNLEIRNQLIELHLPLVKKISSKFKYYPKLLTREDLFQEGILGLIKALNRYEDLGYDFIAYATHHIHFAMEELIRKSHSPAPPREEPLTPSTPYQEEIHSFWAPRMLNPHEYMMKEYYQERLKEVLEKILSPYEFKVLILSFNLPWEKIKDGYQPIFTNQVIAQKLNVPVKQVRKFKNRAVAKMKKDPEIRNICYQLNKLSKYSN